jgi:hypothetical protein
VVLADHVGKTLGPVLQIEGHEVPSIANPKPEKNLGLCGVFGKGVLCP